MAKAKQIFRKLAVSFLLFIVVILVVLFVVTRIIAKRGLPDYGANIQLEHLVDTVKVYRDEVGTPHIMAKNQKDLYRTVGYIMAQERMWQMDLLRRVTQGRLSEIFGKDYIETDLLLRTLRYSEKSEQIIEESPAELINALEAFTDGVNQYITEYQNNLPLEFFLLRYKPEPWEMVHSVNLIGYMAWDLKAGWSELLLTEIAGKVDSIHFAQIYPDQDLNSEVVFEDDFTGLLVNNRLMQMSKLETLGLDVFSGSNNWAVSGIRSQTGLPILANDMHLSYNVPGIWIQIHEKIEGELDVAGLALPGQPFVIVGHNDSIAWGMTNTYVDNLDYYLEKINPIDSNQYLYNGEWKNFEIVNEDIVCGGDVVKKTYRRNHRGPVVSQFKEIKDKVLTMKWVGDLESNELLSIYKVNRAGNWDEFKEAFSTFRSISQNIAYADVKGNIGLYACAGVPVRKRLPEYGLLPGWTDEYDWQGLIPFEKLPHEYNPERGYISSANNKTADSTYPYFIGTWYAMPYRIERIREMLEEKDKFSVMDFKRMQNDSKSKLAERYIEKCFPLIKEEDLNNTQKEALYLLKEWDGTMSKDLIQPTVCESFGNSLVKLVFADELGDELFNRFINETKLWRIALYNLLETEDMIWIDNVNTPRIENLSDIVNEAFKQSISYLDALNRTGVQKWKWGYIHSLTLKHPTTNGVPALDKVFNLNRGPFAVDGSSHTVAPYSYPLFNPDSVYHGASHRHIFSLADWDSTLSVIPTGNSGLVTSEFYLDQTHLYIKGEYHADYFSDEAIRQHSKYTIVVSPKQN